jgi:uncharacterized protein (DUF305 family)
MTRKSLVGTVFAVLTFGAVLAGCGTGHNMPGMGNPTAPSSRPSDHNQADVAFAQQMIPHHSQALDMAKLVAGHTTNSKVVDLAGRIEQAQEPEIQRMSSWLNAWGARAGRMGDMPGMPSDQPMPGMNAPSGVPGMMAADEMTRLEQANNAEFDRMWLQMMIQHHQGAIDMARTELAGGVNSEAKSLAQSIIDGQQAQITEMKGILVQS